MVKQFALGAAGVVWLAAVAGGMWTLAAYSNTPGAVAHAAPAVWPSAARLSRVDGEPVLVMLLHPNCPCSRASVGELARLVALAPVPKRMHVLFYRPAGSEEDWYQTDLWTAAAAIPGVSIRVDDDGAEARSFGVATSGHVLFYDGGGRLRFTGGITASRGRSGDSVGLTTIVALLLKQPARVSATSVFGCSLVEPSTSSRR